jgi:hypothetical protein
MFTIFVSLPYSDFPSIFSHFLQHWYNSRKQRKDEEGKKKCRRRMRETGEGSSS